MVVDLETILKVGLEEVGLKAVGVGGGQLKDFGLEA